MSVLSKKRRDFGHLKWRCSGEATRVRNHRSFFKKLSAANPLPVKRPRASHWPTCGPKDSPGMGTAFQEKSALLHYHHPSLSQNPEADSVKLKASRKDRVLTYVAKKPWVWGPASTRDSKSKGGKPFCHWHVSPKQDKQSTIVLRELNHKKLETLHTGHEFLNLKATSKKQ